MAKGDDSRARNRLDEQQKLAQGYLSGVQQNLANQSGSMSSFYNGGQTPQVGGTFGYGSTVPQFSWTGSPYFSGNGTDTPTPISGGYSPSNNESTVNEIRRYLESQGSADSSTLERALPYLQQKYGVRADSSGGPLDELVMPDGTVVDFIGNAEGGGTKRWTSQIGGGGGFGGGIPGRTLQDYGDIMGQYGGLLGDYKNFFGDARGQWGGFLGSASNMANTGGLSEGDKANLRSRAISPIRAMYANSLRNVERQRSLQGGYSPGYGTLMSRMNRDTGQGISDATTNAEAAIAEMVQKGKLGGLSAWGSGLSGMTAGLGGLLGGMGNTIGGMTGLYSATPGMATTFGNQALAANAQNLDAAKIQSQLGLGLIGAQTEAGKLPGKFQSAVGNIGSALNLGSSIAGMAYPWFGGGFGGSSSGYGAGTGMGGWD